ncbi:hypothetical protein [Streptomyces sp. NPDC088752]|uniref:hypothetical protein n=1 Tax=Streptomyces sp. NPDC088752 TaxID=3154963 RepID=UPI00343DD04B
MTDTSPYTSWWATDGSLKPKMTAQRLAHQQKKSPGYTDDLHGYMALIPCGEDGTVRGPGRLVTVELASRSPSQLELLAVLCAHVLACAEDQWEQPLIYTDCSDTGELLDRLLGLRTKRPGRRQKNFKPLPELLAVIEALGDEVDYLHTEWRPRRSNPALRRADDLTHVRYKPSADLQPEDWIDTPFQEVLSLAKEIGKRS